MESNHKIISPKFLKIELLIFLFLDLLCLITTYLEDFVFSFRYYEMFTTIIFGLYLPLIIIFSLILSYQILLAYLKLENRKNYILKIKIFVIEILFFTAVASEIIISAKIRL
jgi:hypothetical protein